MPRSAWPVTLLFLALAPLYGQLTFADDRVAIHGSFSQGFMYSNHNNYLTLPTSSGSFAFTDGSVNVSAVVTSKLRVGAQGYTREIGQLGKGHVVLDWAMADYRFNDFFGVRAGKVKTVFGLYNDTQDLEFLHTWALLPQALYPLDLRGAIIAHTGGDVYGSVSPEHIGTFSYNAYAGRAPGDLAGGYQYGIAAAGIGVSRIKGSIYGADFKWNMPVPGLLVGAAFLASPQHFSGINLGSSGNTHFDASKTTWIFSAQYSHGNWHFDAEGMHRETNLILLNRFGPFGPPKLTGQQEESAWYASAAYRVNKYLELGTYHGEYFPYESPEPGAPLSVGAARYIYDQAITARFDVNRYWDFKVEGHFLDGYGSPLALHGFYSTDNPQGLTPRTNLLVIRMGLNL